MAIVGPFGFSTLVPVAAYCWTAWRLVQARSPVLRATALVPAIWIWSTVLVGWIGIEGSAAVVVLWGNYVTTALAFGIIIARLMPDAAAARRVHVGSVMVVLAFMAATPGMAIDTITTPAMHAVVISYGLIATLLICRATAQRAMDGDFVASSVLPVLVVAFSKVVVIWARVVMVRWWSGGESATLDAVILGAFWTIVYLQDAGLVAATWFATRREAVLA